MREMIYFMPIKTGKNFYQYLTGQQGSAKVQLDLSRLLSDE